MSSIYLPSSPTTTRLTDSKTPTYEDLPDTHNTRLKKNQKVTFSPDSEIRTTSPNSINAKHTVTIKTGVFFERSPQVRELLSPDTLQSIEKERNKSLRTRPGGRIISQDDALSVVYDRRWRVQTQAQDSSACATLWFPLLMVGLCLFMGLAAKYGGTTSDQREG